MRPHHSLIRSAAAALLLTLLPVPHSLDPKTTAVAQTSQDRKAEADRLFKQGIQQYQTNQFEAALNFWQQALQIYREVNDRSKEGLVLGNLGILSNSLNNYDKAISYYEQGLIIAQEIKNQPLEGGILRNLGLVYVSLGNYDKAITLYKQSLTIYQQIKNRDGEAGVLNNLGGAYCFLSQYDQVIAYSQQALPILQQIKDRDGEALALSNLGRGYNALSQYEKAISYYQQALNIYQQIRDPQSEANVFNSLGLAYDSLSQYDKAITYYQQAMPIFVQAKDRHGEARVLHNLGLAYRHLSQYDKAITYYQQAITIYQQVEDRDSEASILNNLGVVYNSLAQYAKALAYYEQAMAIYQQVKDYRSEADVLNSLGETYRSIAQYDKAIAYYQQALSLYRQVTGHHGEANTLMNLGSAYDSLSQYDQAITYYQRALPIFVQVKDRDGEANLLTNLGGVYNSLLQYDKAIAYHQQALGIYQQVKNRNGEAKALNNLGNVYASLLQYRKSIVYHQQSQSIFAEVKDHDGEAKALNNLGESFYKLGDLATAEIQMFASIALYESIRVNSGTDQNKVSIFEEQTNTYGLLQKVLVAQHQPNAALEIAERGRARALVELLAQQLGKESGVRSQESGVKPPNLAQIQQISKVQNATLVEYSIIDDDFKIEGKTQVKESALYIWAIQPNGQITFRSVDLKPLWKQQKTTLAELVENSRKGIGVSDRGDRATLKVSLTPEYLQQLHKQQSRYLHQLHQLLIEPIADLLSTDPTAHIIFMPQKSLFLVPFAALQDKTDQYLIQQHTISIAPAIQVLGLTHQQRQALQPTTNVLVAGNPIMPQVTVPGADAPLVLPDLPGARDEAIAVAKTLSTTALTGKQATKHAIVQQMQTARIIHLATHGLLDDFKGLGVPGAIVLAPDGNGQPNDGLLTADDILSMKLNAELVVLSACNTGRGNLTGDGVIGLSRSLISAGTPSVMVSLWSVPDAPTAALMTDFYQNWQTTHLDKAQALRQAMLDTMKRHPDPRDWAAFTLIGEAQ